MPDYPSRPSRLSRRCLYRGRSRPGPRGRGLSPQTRFYQPASFFYCTAIENWRCAQISVARRDLATLRKWRSEIHLFQRDFTIFIIAGLTKEIFFQDPPITSVSWCFSIFLTAQNQLELTISANIVSEARPCYHTHWSRTGVNHWLTFVFIV